MRDDVDYAVRELVCAVQREGFEEVRDQITSLPDQDEQERPVWQAALIEGIADAVRYAQAIREGRSYLKVQFKPGESATFEWERGKPVEGEFRQAADRAVASLLDGKGMGDG